MVNVPLLYLIVTKNFLLKRLLQNRLNLLYIICQLLNLPYTEHYFSLCNNPFKLYNCFHLISIIFYLIE